MRGGWRVFTKSPGRLRLLLTLSALVSVAVPLAVWAITWSTQTWDLSPSSEYTVSDVNKIVFSPGPPTVAGLKLNSMADHIENADTGPTGFTGTRTNLVWPNPPNNHLELPSTQVPRERDAAASNLTALWRFNEVSGATVGDTTTGSATNLTANDGLVRQGTPGFGDGGSAPHPGPTRELGNLFDVFGNRTQALRFNGSNEFAWVNNHAEVQPTSQLSAEAWVKFTSMAAAQVLLSEQGLTIATFPYLNPPSYILYESGLQFTFCVSDNSNFPSPRCATSTIAAPGVQPNTWYYVVGTFDGTTVNVYVNPPNTSPSGTAGGGALTLSYPSPVRPKIGVNTPANVSSFLPGIDLTIPNFLNGVLDEVALYNTALTGATIKNNYDTRVSLFNPTIGSYVSPVIDAGPLVTQWRSLDWVEGPTPTGAGLGEEVSTGSANLVSLWHFNASSGTNVADAKGSNTGTLAYGAGGPYWTTGKFGNGLYLDGSDDQVTITETTPLNMGQITIEAWARFDALTSMAPLFNRRTAGNVGGVTLELGASNDLNFFAYISGAWRVVNSGANTLSIGPWYHLAATYDGSAMRLYINGVQAGATAIVGAINNPASPAVKIGQNISFGTLLKGTVDEVAIYNTALPAAGATTNDILTHYRQGALNLRFQGRSGSTTPPDATWPAWKPADGAPISNVTYGLVGLWHFDEASAPGQPATDAIGGPTNTSADNGTVGAPIAGDVAEPSRVAVAGRPTFINALQFAGVQAQYVSLSNGQLNPPTRLSVEAWVNYTASAGTRYLIYKKTNGATNAAYGLSLNGSNQFSFQVANGATAATATDTAAATAGQWHHVIGTYDGVNVKLYVNGQLRTTTPSTLTPSYDGATPVYFGRSDSGNYFTGLLDEVAIYTLALDEHSIIDHYLGTAWTVSPAQSATSIVPDYRYFQFRAFLTSDQLTLSPQLASVTVKAQNYPTDNPTIIISGTGPKPVYNLLNSFTENPAPTTAVVQGSIRYQLSPNGTTWDWYNGFNWVVSSVNPLDSNTASQLTSPVIAQFPLAPPQGAGSPGNLQWKAILFSDGSQRVELDKIVMEYASSSFTLTAPSIAGETWLVGSTHIITWDKTGSTIGSVKLEYAPDGVTFQEIDPLVTKANGSNLPGCTALAGKGCYAWTLPANLPSSSNPNPGQGASKLRISGADAGSESIIDTAPDSGSFTVSQLQLNTPVANATWLVGKQYNITWSTSATDATKTVKLEYSAKGDFTDAVTLTSGTVAATATTFPWTPTAANVPVAPATSNPGQIGVSRFRIAYDAAATEQRVSATAFTVSQLDLTAPVANATWLVGKQYNITWSTSATDATKLVTVKYAADGTNFTTTLGTAPATDRQLPWTPTAADVSSPASNPNTGVSKVRIAYVDAPSEFKSTPNFTVTKFNVVAVIDPPPNDQWRLGKTHKITWDASATGLNQVKIEYSSANGAPGTWKEVPSTPSSVAFAPLSYSWDLPGTDLSYLSCNVATPLVCPNPSGLIRVTVIDPPGLNVLSNNSAAFTVTNPFVRIVEPHAGEVLGVGTVKDIVWEKEGQIGTNLRIEYSTNGFADESQTVIIVNGDNGATSPVVSPYSWVVPNQAASPTVKIRIQDRESPDGTGTSEQFKVAGSINIAAPIAGLKWAVGKAHSIQWTTKGQINNVKIELSRNGGLTFPTVIAASVPNGVGGGSFSWTPAAGDASANAVIRLSDAADPQVLKQSAAFLVTDATITNPTGGERWLVGDATKTITWTSTGVTNVRLEYSTDDGTTFPYLITATVLASNGSLPWTIPNTIKKATVKIRILDADATAESQAARVSNGFTIYGQLSLTAPATNDVWNSGQPHTITWTTPVGTIPTIQIEYSTGNINNAAERVLITASAVNGSNPGCTAAPGTGCYVWTPDFTAGNIVRMRISDAQDPFTFSISGFFQIPGIAMQQPAGGEVWPVNSSQTITWTSTGSFTQVKLEYSTDNFATATLIQDNVLNTGNFVWTPIPDAISTNAKVRVTPTTDATLFSISNPFTITGVLTVTAPGQASGQVFDAGSDVPITWTTVGTIPLVSLEYTTNGSTWNPVLNGAGTPATAIANASSFPWRVPGTISTQVKVRVKDAVAGHPATSDVSDNLFTIRAAFQMVEPTGASTWGVYQSPATPDVIPPITWSTVGTVQKVKIEYSLDSFACSPASNCGLIAASADNTTQQYAWTVPDLISPMVLAGGGTPGDAVPTHSLQVKIRVSDADAGHPAASTMSPAFTVKWFKINFEVLDEDNLQLLNSLSVSDHTPLLGSYYWDVSTNSLNPVIFHYYPYGNFDTSWGSASYFSKVVSWTANRDATATAQYDKKVTVRLLSRTAEQVPYQVKTEYAYDPATDTLKFKTWLEKRGLLVGTNPNDFANLGASTVEIYFGTTLLTTLNQATPDANGAYDFTWTPTNLTSGNVYFAKASVVFPVSTTSPPGTIRTSGGGVNISIPKQIAAINVSVGAAALTQIQSDVTAIKTETVGPASTLGQVNTAVGATLPGLIGGVQATANAIKTDTVAIKAETDTISSQVLPAIANVGTKVDNVQAYLSDPTAGLPKILSNQTGMQNQLKAQRRGGILNRDMQLDTNQTATIQYRSEGGVLDLKVYNSMGAVVGGIPPLNLNATTGLYESTFSLAAAGEYRAVVNEGASTNSAGTVDGITLTVKPSVAQDLSNITTLLTNLGTQINTIDTNVNNLAATAAAIQADTTIIKTQANGISADTQALLAKWGTLDAQALTNQLNALSTQIGTPAQEASVQAALSQLSTLQTGLANLSTQIGTPAQAGALQAVADQVTAVQSAIAALPGAINYTARFDQVDATLASLSTQVGTPAQAAALGSVITTLGTIQTDMAKDVTVQNALTQLGQVQAQLTTLAGTVAKDVDVQTALTQLSAIQTGMAKDADVQVALTQLTTLQNVLTALSGQVGTPAQEATLTGAITTLGQIQANMATEASLQSALTGLSTLQGDLTALSNRVGTPAQEASVQSALSQIANVQSDLTALAVQVGTPAQAAALQAVADQVTAVQTAIAAIPGALNYTARFNQLDSVLSGLSTQMGTPAQQAEMANAITALNAIQIGMATAADIQTKYNALSVTLGALSTQVGTPAQAAVLTNAVNTLNAIQTDMAQGTDLQTALTQLGQVQSDLTALSGSVAKDIDVQAALTQLGTIQSVMATEASVQNSLTSLGTLQTNVANLSTQMGTPAQDAAVQALAAQVTAVQNAIASIPGAIDYSPQLTALSTSLTALNAAMGTPSQAAAVQAVATQVTALQTAIASLPGAVNYTPQLNTLQTDLTALQATVNDPAQVTKLADALALLDTIKAQVTALQSPADFSSNFKAVDTALAGLDQSVVQLKESVGTSSTTSLLARLDELQKSVESSQGSAAAVGFSQGAYSAAGEAVRILQQLQTEIKTNTIQSPGVPIFLGKFGQKWKEVSDKVTLIPGEFNAAELHKQLAQLTERVKAMAAEKGYNFDSLYQMTQSQGGDVKTVRNQVQELKALVEVQKTILEQKLNEPVMKTWFESQ